MPDSDYRFAAVSPFMSKELNGKIKSFRNTNGVDPSRDEIDVMAREVYQELDDTLKAHRARDEAEGNLRWWESIPVDERVESAKPAVRKPVPGMLDYGDARPELARVKFANGQIVKDETPLPEEAAHVVEPERGDETYRKQSAEAEQELRIREAWRRDAEVPKTAQFDYSGSRPELRSKPAPFTTYAQRQAVRLATGGQMTAQDWERRGEAPPPEAKRLMEKGNGSLA